MSEVPPPQPTQIAGQESTPVSTVPHTPGLPGYAPSTTQNNNLAVVSLVAGIGSFFAHIIPGVGGFTVALIAIITGFMARSQIKRTGEQGIWMANVGIIVGFVHLALLLLLVVLFLFLIFLVGVTLFGISAHGGGVAPTPVPSS